MVGRIETGLRQASLTSGSMSDPAGFISIDCGSNSTYTDSNSITWVPDTGYIFTGRNFNPMQLPGLPPSSLLSLRYFPEDRTKHCYNLPANRSQKYMVRVTFVYFDFLGTGASPPTFNLEIQAQLAGTVSFTSSIVSYFETYFVTTSDSIFVCLARINSTSGTTPTSTTTGGIPFITSLELRALDTASMYSAIVQQGLSMYNIWRRNVGATSDQEIRYIIKSSSLIQHITPSHFKLECFLSLSAVLLAWSLSPLKKPFRDFATSIAKAGHSRQNNIRISFGKTFRNIAPSIAKGGHSRQNNRRNYFGTILCREKSGNLWRVELTNRRESSPRESWDQ